MVTGLDIRNIRDAYLTISEHLPLEDIKVRQRLDRAYDIIVGYGYNIEKLSGDQGYIISKASTSLLEDNTVQYCVSLKECPCRDYATARGNMCKHRMAVMMVAEMEQST